MTFDLGYSSRRCNIRYFFPDKQVCLHKIFVVYIKIFPRFVYFLITTKMRNEMPQKHVTNNICNTNKCFQFHQLVLYMYII